MAFVPLVFPLETSHSVHPYNPRMTALYSTKHNRKLEEIQLFCISDKHNPPKITQNAEKKKKTIMVIPSHLFLSQPIFFKTTPSFYFLISYYIVKIS